MIGAASEQMTQLLDLLGAAARIEAGRVEFQGRAADSRQLAGGAVARLEAGDAVVDGQGALVHTDPSWTQTALAALGECVRRHGALEQVIFAVDGLSVSIGPLADGVGSIARGDDLRDFAAAVGTRVLRAMGAEIRLDGDRLVVLLPEA